MLWQPGQVTTRLSLIEINKTTIIYWKFFYLAQKFKIFLHAENIFFLFKNIHFAIPWTLPYWAAACSFPSYFNDICILIRVTSHLYVFYICFSKLYFSVCLYSISLSYKVESMNWNVLLIWDNRLISYVSKDSVVCKCSL